MLYIISSKAQSVPPSQTSSYLPKKLLPSDATDQSNQSFSLLIIFFYLVLLWLFFFCLFFLSSTLSIFKRKVPA